jgi:hypothetical protein
VTHARLPALVPGRPTVAIDGYSGATTIVLVHDATDVWHVPMRSELLDVVHERRAAFDGRYGAIDYPPERAAQKYLGGSVALSDAARRALTNVAQGVEPMPEVVTTTKAASAVAKSAAAKVNEAPSPAAPKEVKTAKPETVGSLKKAAARPGKVERIAPTPATTKTKTVVTKDTVTPPKVKDRILRAPANAAARLTWIAKENPKRAGSAAADRYAKYSKAKTVGEFFALGGSALDLANDTAKGFVKVTG